MWNSVKHNLAQNNSTKVLMQCLCGYKKVIRVLYLLRHRFDAAGMLKENRKGWAGRATSNSVETRLAVSPPQLRGRGGANGDGASPVCTEKLCELLLENIDAVHCGLCLGLRFVPRRTGFARRCSACCVRAIRRHWRNRLGLICMPGQARWASRL